MISYSKLPLFSVTSSIFNPILKSSLLAETNSSQYPSTTVIEPSNEISLRQLQQPTEILNDSDLEQEIRQASHLLLVALRQQDKEYGGDEKLRRVLIVHSIARILQAATPENLTDAEVCELRASLPPEILDFNEVKVEEPYVPQNKLEALVVTLVRAFFLGLKTAAPFTKEILFALAREERKYKISEKVVGVSLSTAETVCNSTIGKALIARSQGVVGSVFRGVTQGMAVMMVDIQDQPTRRPAARHRKSVST